MTFKWWTIAIVAGLVLMFYFIKKQNERDHQKKLKELEDEFNRLHEMEDRMQRNKSKKKIKI